MDDTMSGSAVFSAAAAAAAFKTRHMGKTLGDGDDATTAYGARSRRGSSCDGAGANPFYLRARRRESHEDGGCGGGSGLGGAGGGGACVASGGREKKFSLDNQLPTIY